MNYRTLTAAAMVALMAAGAAQAAEHEIRMLNKGDKGMMVFEPDFVRAAPGDTIRFVPADKGHNAQTIKGMIPEGAKPFKGRISRAFTVTLNKEGVYGVKCMPHYALGMVALIEVGKPVNLDQAKEVHLPRRAKKIFANLFKEAAAAE